MARGARHRRLGGFDATELVVVTASDALTRSEIVQLALQRATAKHGSFDRVVSVGDAVWDVHTAAAVGWPFVGTLLRGSTGGAS